MNKSALIHKIVAHLENDLKLYTAAARASHAEATHEQNKADNKYDTRGLEASYLARGQSRQLAEAERSIAKLRSLVVREFTPQDPIDLTAFVLLEGPKDRGCYFIAPCAGGTEIQHDKMDILVITPHSPLGQQLMEKKQGDRLQIEIAGRNQEYHVARVN